MDSNLYEIGVYFSLFYWLYQSIFLIILINSQMEKNLNKVYQRLSWSTFRTKQIESYDEVHPHIFKMIMKYIFIILVNLLLIFLSWVYLFYVFVNTMFNRYKRDGEPEVMKTFRWRMRNSNLSYEQILQELYKIELTNNSFDDFKSNYEHRVKVFLGEI
jgi:hypothetical protein